MMRGSTQPVRVLVTGFGPFPGIPYNASASLVLGLAHAAPAPGLEIATAIIPVVWANARDAAREAAAQFAPHAILHFGVAKRAAGFEVEARAFNRSGLKEDHAGIVRASRPLVRAGRPVLASTLPAAALVRALRKDGYPATVSRDAGRYLCNALFYWSLNDSEDKGRLVGFIHMPAFGVETTVKPAPHDGGRRCRRADFLRASAEAVLRARQTGLGERGGGAGHGSQALYRNGRGSGRLGGSVDAAHAAQAASGRSIADFGVEPNAERDQSAAMQRAVDALTAEGLPVVIPAGKYRAAKVQLPSKASVLGAPGLTLIAAPDGAPPSNAGTRTISGCAASPFWARASSRRSATLLHIADCRVISSGGDGLVCSGSGLLVTGNRASDCARAAIWVEGDGMVTANLIGGVGQFGLRLGSAWRLGTMTVINNRIDGPEVGIAASASDVGYALIAMNMIAGAKNGGIRALNGEELIGKDLTRGGSEAFRNLAIAANVSL